jgi:hypothetical protein
MNKPSYYSVMIVVVLVFGIIIGGLFDPFQTDGSSVDASDPAYVTSIYPVCTVENQSDRLTGWLFESTTGNSKSIFYNQTISHDRGETINVTLQSNMEKNYVLDISIVDENRSNLSSARSNCQRKSTVEVGMSLPLDYQQLSIVRNNQTVKTIRNGGMTAPELYYVNASG